MFSNVYRTQARMRAFIVSFALVCLNLLLPVVPSFGQVTLNSVTPSACNAATNTYSLTVSYTLGASGLSDGELVITTTGGKTTVISSTLTPGNYTTTFSGLPSDGKAHDVTAFFTQNNPPIGGSASYTAPASCITNACTPSGLAKSQTYTATVPMQLTELQGAALPIPKFNTMGGTRMLQKMVVTLRATVKSHVMTEIQSTSAPDVQVNWGVYGALGIGDPFQSGNPTVLSVQAKADNRYHHNLHQVLVPASGAWAGDIMVGSRLSTLARMDENGAIANAMEAFIDPRTLPEWVTNVTGDPATDDDFIYSAPYTISNSSTSVLTSGFTKYTGAGDIDFRFSTLSILEMNGGGGNFMTKQSTQAGADVSVTYFYCDAPVSLGSTVFNDKNNNGLHDADETGIAGASVQLYAVDGVTQIGSPVLTDANGNYFFSGLVEGSYRVGVNAPAAYTKASTIAGGDDDVDLDNNGVQAGGAGSLSLSGVIVLSPGTESTSESTTIDPTGGAQDDNADSDGNMTVDFGFYDLASLPVSLIDFKVRNRESVSELSWTTANEVDFDRFVVESSRDGLHFAEIGNVNGGGSQYRFEDQTPFAGVNYYRLKMVDVDASYSYSRMVSVNIADGRFATVQNPAAGGRFRVFTNLRKPSFRLVDLSGRPSPIRQATVSENVFELTLIGARSGLYLLIITSDGRSTTQKVVVP